MASNADLVRLTEDCNFTHYYNTERRLMEKFKKIDKEFLLTDNTVNCYGFRLLTSGYLLDEFKKNPIGYHLHANEEMTEHTRKDGVLVRWDDFRTDGDKVYAKPSINLSHPRGQRTVDEIENGFLNAASIGQIVAIDIDENPANFLTDQTGPTVTKWFNRECSLVDIPGNYNAVSLFDKEGKPINLADFTQSKITSKMKVINVTAANLAAMNLTADAEQAAFETSFTDLVAKAKKVDQLTTDLAAANTAKTNAENALTEFKKTANTEKVADLVAKGVTDKKWSVQEGELLKADYALNADGLQKIYDARGSYVSLADTIEKGGQELKDLMAKSYTELDKGGKLEKLKSLSMESFKAKYKEQFGSEYAGK